MPPELEFDTKVLRYLVAIVDEKSLSRAAEKVYLSQPALSRHLRAMEDALGTPLFIRSHNSLELTNAGKVFINGARSILHIEQAALARLEQRRLQQTASLTLAVQPPWDWLLASRVSPAFAARFPQTSLSVCPCADAADALHRIREGTAGLAFFFCEDDGTAFPEGEALLREEVVFCAAADSPSLPGARGGGFAPGLFAGQEQMAFSGFFEQMQQRLFARDGGCPPPLCCSAGLPVLRQLLELGRGNVLLPASAVPPAAKDRCFPLAPPLHICGILAHSPGIPLRGAALEYAALARELLSACDAQALWGAPGSAGPFSSDRTFSRGV